MLKRLRLKKINKTHLWRRRDRQLFVASVMIFKVCSLKVVIDLHGFAVLLFQIFYTNLYRSQFEINLAQIFFKSQISLRTKVFDVPVNINKYLIFIMQESQLQNLYFFLFSIFFAPTNVNKRITHPGPDEQFSFTLL
jgi:hypothetical protein